MKLISELMENTSKPSSLRSSDLLICAVRFAKRCDVVWEVAYFAGCGRYPFAAALLAEFTAIVGRML